MQNKRNKKPADATPGFAVKITDETELRLAMLICEDEDGRYEPVAVASTINEARELAEHHFRHRCNDMDSGLCPYTYKLWANGIEGGFSIAIELDPLKFF